MVQQSSAVWKTVLLGVIVFALALITRTGLIAFPPIYDELYQMLPARSWSKNGTLAVLDGVYDRASVFTRLIAFSFDLLGNQDLATARLIPSVIPGALLVVIVVLWTRAVIGLVAAGFAVVFLLLWPNGIEVSQYIRFYALHGLIFVIGALMVYGALTGGIALRWRILLLIVALSLFLFALHLQILTIIGVGAIGLWVMIVLMPGWLAHHPWGWWLIAAVVVVSAAVLVSGVFTETLRGLWASYHWEPWPAQTDTFLYHRKFRDNYPTFWPLFPLATLVALRAYPRPASLCLVLFATAFVLQSFGGLKSIRYLYPMMPFFFVLWAAALQALLPAIWNFIRRTAHEAVEPFVPKAMQGGVAMCVIIVAGLFLFGANAAFERSIQLVRGKPADILLGKKRWTWPEAREMAAPWLADGAVVVTSEEMLAIEWLGDFDIGYNKPRFSELLFVFGPDTQPFTIDPRTGRPLIGELEDMSRIIACEPVGILLTNVGELSASPIPLSITLLAWKTGAEVTVESGPGMALIGWRRKGTVRPALGNACATLPTAGGDRAADRLAWQ